MTTNTLKIIEDFYKENIFSSRDLLNYDKEDTFKITHMPLEKFENKVPNELISKLIEPYFLKNKYYDEIMKLLIENVDEESLYFLMYTAYYKALLEDEYKISDEYCLSDLNMIAESDKNLSRHLMTTAVDLNSLKSMYHGFDMDILKDETACRAELLNLITTNIFSLNSSYHESDMELLTKQKDDDIFYSLLIVADDKNSLNSLYHESDMDLINSVDDSSMAIPLSFVAISKYSLENNHEEDINRVLGSDTYDEANKYASKLLYKKH